MAHVKAFVLASVLVLAYPMVGVIDPPISTPFTGRAEEPMVAGSPAASPRGLEGGYLGTDAPSGEAEGASVGSHTSAVAPWVSSPFSGPASDAPLANFGVIADGIASRSAQPTAEGYSWLIKEGFRSIVSLRRGTGDQSNHVLELGFKNYLWLSIEDETDPTDEQALRFLDFMTDSRNWPVLIHCKVGLGRTGTMAALLRYAVDGWTMEEAIAEARVYRGGVDLIPAQIEWLERWAAKHPPGCHRPASPGTTSAQ
ncbi:MAG: dual specificity protein phosphatase family protein [Chloroflexi bacterium]|nr:dual specificity protein phosphatase family protein [Chloroflexota bacterium]